MDERQWYAEHGCEHAHCPLGCEKPQPFLAGTDLLCGRCLIQGVVSVCIPCTPETCD